MARAAGDQATTPEPQVTPPLAGAPPAPAAPTAAAPPPERWYGYQLILADAASLSLGLAFDRLEPMLVGYVVGPIVLHGLHRRATAAILSPLMRVFLPAMGAAIGSNFKHCNASGDECSLGGALTGAGIGISAALILDWSFAWTKAVTPPARTNTEPHAEGSTRGPRASGFGLTAAGLTPIRAGLGLALAGTF